MLPFAPTRPTDLLDDAPTKNYAGASPLLDVLQPLPSQTPQKAIRKGSSPFANTMNEFLNMVLEKTQNTAPDILKSARKSPSLSPEPYTSRSLSTDTAAVFMSPLSDSSNLSFQVTPAESQSFDNDIRPTATSGFRSAEEADALEISSGPIIA